MAQGMFGGLTSYRTQSLQDIFEDIERWIEFTTEIEKLVIARCTKLENVGYWDKIPFNFQNTIFSSIKYFNTIKYDLSLVKSAIEKDYVTEKEVTLLKSIGHNAIDYNIEYGKTYKEDLHIWSDYNNSNFKIAEEIYKEGRDYFVTMQDVSNAAHRLEEYMTKENITKNIVNIGDNATRIQLQQGTINSIQTSNENNINYNQTLDVLYKIDALLENNKVKENCDGNSKEIKKIVLETIHMIEQKEAPAKVKKALSIIKKLAAGITENIIANQIVALITQLLANF